LEHHIDRRVILSTESEFKSLYPWSLQELDAEGEKIGRDQIPWEWTLYFTATELALSDTLKIEPDYRSDVDSKITVRERQNIRTKLTPGDPWEGGRSRDPAYSMFGTDRTISSFELFIERLESEDENERCTAWGSVSYTFDNDFRDETSDDTVVFHLYVRPETFARYAAKISAGEVDEAVLRVSHVKGFYSDWSPAISTNSIKVLTGYEKEHPVEVPEGCEIVPPRLGSIGEAELYLRRINKLEGIPRVADEDDWLEDDDPTEAAHDKAALAAQHSASSNARAVALLSSLRTAAWAIVALLLLLILTR
jgi:hypothetical protein